VSSTIRSPTRAAHFGLTPHPVVYDRLFDKGERSKRMLRASPFLVFAVLVHRCAEELRGASFVHEWVAPHTHIPVFDVADLRDFLGDPERRLFLAELLASYTHVASGAVWARGRRGWRRQKFSELDPVQLVQLLDVVTDEERPGIYRRLGDLALFLTGVFPDHDWSLGPVQAARLRRVTSSATDDANDGDGLLLEQLGERWYHLACATARSPKTHSLRVVAVVGERFRDARRVLNFMTERHLFPVRGRWYPDVTY
jgi:hypothetical protein